MVSDAQLLLTKNQSKDWFELQKIEAELSFCFDLDDDEDHFDDLQYERTQLIQKLGLPLWGQLIPWF